MRFHFDPRKSERLRRNPRRGIGFEEAVDLFSRPWYQDIRSDLPEQHRAIGWVGERLYTLIFEIREDAEGEVAIWSLSGKRLARSEPFMKNTRSSKTKPADAESIARMADKGQNVSSYFTNAGKMMLPVQRVNVDFTASMLEELDLQALELNISRQAVIKTLVRQGLDRHYSAKANRNLS